MTENKYDQLIDKAVKTAGILGTSDKKGSTQINNLLGMLQADKSEHSLKVLMLYVARQSGKDRNVLKPELAKDIINNIKWINETFEKDAAVNMAIDYLTYIKWALDALSGVRSGTSGITNFDSFLKKVIKN